MLSLEVLAHRAGLSVHRTSFTVTRESSTQHAHRAAHAARLLRSFYSSIDYSPPTCISWGAQALGVVGNDATQMLVVEDDDDSDASVE